MALILVIDDDAQVRNLIVRVLTDAGHTLSEAEDGDEGLNRIVADEPNLVITDILMPNREGIETIMQIKRQYPTVKILAISGGGDFVGHSYLDTAKRLGADDVIPKPFKRSVLLEAVKRLLARNVSRE